MERELMTRPLNDSTIRSDLSRASAGGTVEIEELTERTHMMTTTMRLTADCSCVVPSRSK